MSETVKSNSHDERLAKMITCSYTLIDNVGQYMMLYGGRVESGNYEEAKGCGLKSRRFEVTGGSKSRCLLY